MKSGHFTRLAATISLTALGLVSGVEAGACGPYYPMVPTVAYFSPSPTSTRIHQKYKQENLRLWQEMTSGDIPLSDIEAAVYKSTGEELEEMLSGDRRNANKFCNYLVNTRDDEAIEFLTVAKNLEELRAKECSPWYYPKERYGEREGYEETVESCRLYEGKRMRERFGLQGVRALFAARQYDECVRYFDEVFGGVSDDNLFKRMSTDYIAGCWMYIGDTVRANEYFVRAGDMESLRVDNPVAYMAEKNPDSPQLLGYVSDNLCDSARASSLEPLARRVLRDGKSANPGDWYFVLGYIAGEHRQDWQEAGRLMRKAMGCKFSSEELGEHARAFRMKTDGALGRRENLLADLKWIEGKMNMLNPDANHWERILQNAVMTQWTPRLWKEKDYATAILLTGYAENIKSDSERNTAWGTWPVYSVVSLTTAEMRRSENAFNMKDYGSLTFQLMGSLSSRELASAKERIDANHGALYTLLKKHARTDDDYFNELTGTLAMREEDYGRAVKYLSRVSPGYERTLNIYKEGELQRDAFAYRSPGDCKPGVEAGYKLDFARRMRDYGRQMQSGATADERAMAALMYAIGRYNAQEECWALTRYWDGSPTTLFAPYEDYWDWSENDRYAFLWDYESDPGYTDSKERLKAEIGRALASFGTDEGRAQAEYVLGNLRTVVKRYPQTAMAEQVRSSCDRWKNWL